MQNDKITIDYKNNPIFITGAPRSGTSMTAGIIYHLGAWGGKLAGPNLYNLKGMFENTEIREHVLKSFLKSIECDPLGQSSLPDINIIKTMSNRMGIIFREQILNIILKQKYKNDRLWFYKGAKMCLLWPIFTNAFPFAKWILVRRKDSDIVQSCLKTKFMRAFNSESGWYCWLSHHKDRFAEMKADGLQIKEIWPETLIAGNLEPAQELADWVELKWNDNIIKTFIEPRLWKGGNFGY